MRRANDGTDRQTDRRTSDRYVDPLTMQAVSIMCSAESVCACMCVCGLVVDGGRVCVVLFSCTPAV